LVVSEPKIVLVFSFIGYLTNEVDVNGRSVVDVSMAEDVQSLEEIVVVGYGTQKKTSVTAAVSTLKGAEIASTPTTNLSNSLGGRVSGVIVKQLNGQPGTDGSNIYIRGISSTGATQPLVVVDGIPRDFSQLDPNTIESFTVLKDAAAVAPYGVAGANGVILVTTKKGKTGAAVLSYNGYVGSQNPTVLPKYVSGYQYAVLQNAAADGAGLAHPYSDEAVQKLKDGSDPDAYPDPDYRDLIMKNAILSTHNIELSGGTETVKYYGSLGYQYQEGMWPKSNHKRYNLAINIEAQVTKTTKVFLGVNGRVQNLSGTYTPPGRLWEIIGYTHTEHEGPLWFSNGMPGAAITTLVYGDGYLKRNTTALYSQLSLEQEIPFISGLRAKGTIAYDPTIVMNKVWSVPQDKATIDETQTPYVITQNPPSVKPSLSQGFNQAYQLTYQASLDYAKSFGDNHVTALALFEAKGNDTSRIALSRRNYNLLIDEINMGSSSLADMTTSGTSASARQVGFLYRVTYDYASKYLFEASGRYDGSYYFAPGKRFGFFPAFSVGWRLSEEQFIKDVSWIENLKLRASYGEVGALAGSPFQYLSTYNAYGPAYTFGGQAVQGINERNEYNPNITWERAVKKDIGFEVSLWEGLLDVEIDYFHEKRSNMLVAPDVVVPAEYGIGLSQVNGGVMKNQGIDLSVVSTRSLSKDLQVSLGATFTYARNTLLKIFETPTTFNNPNRRRTGRPLGTQFGWNALGYFQVDDFNADGTLKEGIATQPWGKVQPGDIRYQDINLDGKINDDDHTVIGDPANPQIIYGITPNIRYKAFTLDLLFQGAAQTDFYSNSFRAWAFQNGMSAYEDNFDYWTPENPNAKHPRITSAPTTNNTQTSSWWMTDVSYLRLKTATLSFSVPSAFAEKLRMQNARIYVSGQNVITFTNLTNYDPEATVAAYGNLYPQQKVISVGLNVGF
jgi:TonB-linked SusC/RagA family outer membrane protein